MDPLKKSSNEMVAVGVNGELLAESVEVLGAYGKDFCECLSIIDSRIVSLIASVMGICTYLTSSESQQC